MGEANTHFSPDGYEISRALKACGATSHTNKEGYIVALQEYFNKEATNASEARSRIYRRVCADGVPRSTFYSHLEKLKAYFQSVFFPSPVSPPPPVSTCAMREQEGVINQLSIFSGIGSAAKGVRDAVEELFPIRKMQYRLDWACEIDPLCRDIFSMNHGLVPFPDVLQCDPSALPRFPFIATAEFPCQMYSLSGSKNGMEAQKNPLVDKMLEIFLKIRPQTIILENVPNIRNCPVHQTILQFFEREGYFVREAVLDSLHYGVPQSRKRWFLVAFSDENIGKRFRFPSPLPPKTLQDIIHIPRVAERDEKNWPKRSVGLHLKVKTKQKTIALPAKRSCPFYASMTIDLSREDDSSPTIVIENPSKYVIGWSWNDARWIDFSKRFLSNFGGTEEELISDETTIIRLQHFIDCATPNELAKFKADISKSFKKYAIGTLPQQRRYARDDVSGSYLFENKKKKRDFVEHLSRISFVEKKGEFPRFSTLLLSKNKGSSKTGSQGNDDVIVGLSNYVRCITSSIPFLHDLKRPFNVMELKRLFGLGDEYQFPSLKSGEKKRIFGNAVPANLIKRLCLQILFARYEIDQDDVLLHTSSKNSMEKSLYSRLKSIKKNQKSLEEMVRGWNDLLSRHIALHRFSEKEDFADIPYPSRSKRKRFMEENFQESIKEKKRCVFARSRGKKKE